MPSAVHEFRAGAPRQCDAWRPGDAFTLEYDAVTCPACLARRPAVEACPSRSALDGTPCLGVRGHRGTHGTVVDGVVRVWTDGRPPNGAWGLA